MNNTGQLRLSQAAHILIAGAALIALNGTAGASSINFGTDPFEGTTVRSSPGRQVVGGEFFISFNTATEAFVFDNAAFGLNDLRFANGPASSIPSDANMIVLLATDNDNNPLTPFGAGNAADLLADRITTPGPGLFVYFNQSLNLPRLVYSDNLSSNTADLRILARMLNLNGLSGAGALNQLPAFSASNFALAQTAAVPEPASSAMLGGGITLMVLGLIRRRLQAKLREASAGGCSGLAERWGMIAGGTKESKTGTKGNLSGINGLFEPGRSRWLATFALGCAMGAFNYAAAQPAYSGALSTTRIASPPTPTIITPPAGHAAFLLGRAAGTQGYICLPAGTGASWTVNNARPEATLFTKLFGHDFQIVTHFLSPNTHPYDFVPKPVPFGNATWQNSLDSSKVWAQVMNGNSIPAGSDLASCPNTGSIPCLLLQAVGAQQGPAGGSLMTQVTFIQRLNTAGGAAPPAGCATASDVGKQVLVPYSSDYYFFREEVR